MLEHNQLTVSHKDATEAAGAAGFGWAGGMGRGIGAVDDAFATVDDAAAPAASQDSNDNLTSCSPRLPCVCASVFASACACVGAVHLDALQKRIRCMSKQVRLWDLKTLYSKGIAIIFLNQEMFKTCAYNNKIF